MADAFIGEIRLFPYMYKVPAHWALCNGTMLQVSQQTALFSIIGTTYGGDGQTTFQLPNLQEKVPMHPGLGATLSPHTLGETGGSIGVALTTAQMPAHTHEAIVFHDEANQPDPRNAYLGFDDSADVKVYEPATTTPHVAMQPYALADAGGNKQHENRQPFLALRFFIALTGIFPERTQ